MKNRKSKVIISVLCVLLLTAAAAVAVHFARQKTPVPVTTETPTESSTVAVSTETVSLSSKESTSDGEEKELRSITDIAEIDGNYKPIEFEKTLFDGINAEREKHGLKTLEYNSVLHTLAKIRSDEAVNLWSHNRPDGRAPSSVFSDNNLSFSAFSECLARGSDETEAGATLLIEGLLKSDSQAEIIFSDEYDYLAVAVSENNDKTVSAALLFCKA